MAPGSVRTRRLDFFCGNFGETLIKLFIWTMRSDILSAALLSCLLPISVGIYLPFKVEARDSHTPHNRMLRETACNDDEEYEFEGRCCRMCPAGHYVGEHCTRNHAQGLCLPCTSGYAIGLNGLRECQRCRVCRRDEELVRACTATSNTQCQCKAGTYCTPGEACEICTRCTRCSEGQRVKEDCTAVKDTVCENIPGMKPTSEPTTSLPSTHTAPPHRTLTSIARDNNAEHGNGPFLPLFIGAAVVAVAAIIVGAVLVYYFGFRQRNERKQQNGYKNSFCQSTASSSCSTPLMDKTRSENPAVPEGDSRIHIEDDLKCSREVLVQARPFNTEKLPSNPDNSEDPDSRADEDDGGGGEGGRPCNHCDQPPLCVHQWTECFYVFIEHIRANDIIPLIRCLHIGPSDIECITRNNPNDIKERHYQLFDQWRVKLGQRASIKTIITKLNEMNLAGCGENIINSLRSKGIPVM